MSAIGSLNASVFTNGRHYAAASLRGYLPAIFSNGHVEDAEDEKYHHDRVLKSYPAFVKRPLLALANATSDVRFEKDVPVYVTHKSTP